MQMNSHIFKLTIYPVKLATSVSFEAISSRFKNIRLIPVNDFEYELVIKKRSNTSLDVTREEAITEANNLVDRMSLLDNHNIIDLVYIGFTSDSGHFENLGGHSKLTAEATAFIPNPTKFYGQEVNKRLMLSTKNAGAVRTYRSALSIKDEISRFLIFYGLLLILKGETQNLVDEYLKQKIPDILIVRGHTKDETIITNIRNAIAHPKDGIDLRDLRKSVKNYLDTLQICVLEILKS